MLALKPFVRIIILSIILAFLLIYLGVKYHWGDHLQLDSDSSVELTIPDKTSTDINPILEAPQDNEAFAPEIVSTSEADSPLASMNIEQITEHCSNLLSQTIQDALTLELATANCVVSNYQETFQNTNNDLEIDSLNIRRSVQEQCRLQYQQSPQYSSLDKQLLIGICVSDTLNKS